MSHSAVTSLSSNIIPVGNRGTPMERVTSHTAGNASLAQSAADETFKTMTVEEATRESSAVARPPRPGDVQEGLMEGNGYRNGSSASSCGSALKADSWNNFVMSAITAGAYTGISFGMDKVMTPATPAVKKAEKKVEDLEKEFVKVEEKAAASPSPVAEKKVEAVEKKVEQAKSAVETAINKTSSKAPLKGASKPIGIIANAASQLVVSMGVRTAATCMSATSPTFQKNIKYIVPPSSGVLRGVLDYYLFGKSVGRCAANSIVVAGLEFASTGLVMGFK